jgi:pre-mRNA-splicing factor ATP-dependent RNA helicase DHX15/PRP43
LIEYAANYFDLNTFPDGETKRALQRVINKRAGKAIAAGKNERVNDSNGESRPTKKRKKA